MLKRTGAAVFVFVLATSGGVANAACVTAGPATINCPSGGGSEDEAGSSSSSGGSHGSSEAQFLGLINESRAGWGVRPLRRASDVDRIAERHAERMAAEGRVYHNSWVFSEEGGEALGDPDARGENVGSGGSVEALHEGFLGSPPHRANLRSGAYREIGLGVVRDSSGVLWVAQVFVGRRFVAPAPRPARPAASAPAPVAEPAPAPAPPALPGPIPYPSGIGLVAAPPPAVAPAPQHGPPLGGAAIPTATLLALVTVGWWVRRRALDLALPSA